MAKVITVENWKEIDVSNSVGRGGVNSKGDVMVVQALLIYSVSNFIDMRGCSFTQPNGTIDSDTMKNIKRFQQYLRRRLKAPISVDGRIDPSNGKLQIPGKRLSYTICALNAEAAGHHIMFGGGDNYISEICGKYPQVASAIGEVPTGSVHMENINAAPVGTLNLTLE